MVTDTGNHRIQKFTSNGAFICQWGNRGNTLGQVNFPYGVAVDREGFVYVVDSGNARVLKFAPVEGTQSTTQVPTEKGATELSAPAELIAKAGDTEVTLSWMDVPGAASYNLYYHTEASVTPQTATCVESVASPYTHGGLANGTSYYFMLTAVSAEGTESPPSPVVEATPTMVDLAAPQNPYMIINHGAFMTNLPDAILTVSAHDVDSGVAGYFISEAPTTPTASTPGWVDVEPVGKFGATVPYTLSPGDGKKTVYVWFKDGYGNISSPATNSILLNTSGYVCVNLWGKAGSGAHLLHGGEFGTPSFGLTCDQTGNVYVVDTANFRIQKFDRSGEFVMAWGSFGNADGQLYFARGIAVDESDGAVFIVDMGNHRVQKFDTSTNFLPQLLAKWGTKGQEPGQFWNPWGIAVDRDGFVYVTDTGNHRVQKFDRDGNFETQWGGFGSARGQFNFPYGIGVDRRGSIFVLDSSNFRVQQFMTADEGELQLREQAEVAESESSALGEKKTIQQETPGTHLWSTPKQ